MQLEELPKVMYGKLSQYGGLNSTKMRELLKDGPHLFTADGVPICVIMSPDYFRCSQGFNPNPIRQPRFTRIEGVLFMEVV